MKHLVIDVQLLQTPALRRGMGQYIISLINALNSKDTEITLLFSSLINTSFSDEAKKRLREYKQIELPLFSLNQTKHFEKASAHNKRIIDSWFDSEEYHNHTFLISSVFQSEIYPVFPTKAKKAAIMYDVIPLQLFQQYSNKMRWGDYLARFAIVHSADALLCISETTSNDLQLYANVSSKKLFVINGGPGDLAEPEMPKVVPDKPFILMPTGNDIRKNNLNGLEAFSLMNERHDYKYSIVVTSTFTNEERDRFISICPSAIFTGAVSDAELAWYYKNCEALLFPSLYEGLGMPLIEALIFKKPIAASAIDVFLEISESVATYFNPHDINDISRAIDDTLTQKLTRAQQVEIGRVIQKYSWEQTAIKLLEALDATTFSDLSTHRAKIAVVGPHVTGSSAIGKFISELHPVLADRFDIDYYYEKSPVDKVLRPDILGHIVDYKPVHHLTNAKLKKYKEVIYHIGNSNHHSITLARALNKPGIVILHDLNIENVYKDLYERKIIGKDRVEAEQLLDKLKPTKSHGIQSLVSKQNAVIVHSKYAKKIVDNYSFDKVIVKHTNLAVSTPTFLHNKKHKTFTIGLAGILAGIKGLETIERIAQHDEFLHDKFELFGLNFAEPGSLDKLRALPNVSIATDLSDFEFQQNLQSLDVLVNYREKYQGEASYATLEAMRFGIPVIVRGDFGWYSELPDDAVLKANDEADVVEKLREIKKNDARRKSIQLNAHKTVKTMFNAEQYVDAIEGLMQKDTV